MIKLNVSSPAQVADQTDADAAEQQGAGSGNNSNRLIVGEIIHGKLFFNRRA